MVMTYRQQCLAEIEQIHDQRLAFARSMRDMAVRAAESRFQLEVERAAEVRKLQLNDIATGDYTPVLDGSIGVTKMADLSARG